MTLPLPLNTVPPSTAISQASSRPAAVGHGSGADALSTAASQASAGRAYTDIEGLEALKGDTSSPQALRRVAQEVEAMFLQIMLKSMREAGLGDGIFDSQEGRLYQDMFDQQIALNLSQQQQLGISDLLMRQLAHKTGDADEASSATASPRGTTAPPAGAAAMPLMPAVMSLPTRASNDSGKDAAGGRSSTAPATDAQAAEFVAQVLPSIRQAARTLGVDARALLAQAALETGWGQRMPRNADGSSSHNLFGIKAGAGWDGARATAVTVEFDGLVARRSAQAFRSYLSVEESVTDFTRLLAGTPRYAQALAQGGSATAYTRSLAAAGYATDPDYASKINRILDSARMRAAFPVRTAALQK